MQKFRIPSAQVQNAHQKTIITDYGIYGSILFSNHYGDDSIKYEHIHLGDGKTEIIGMEFK